MNIKIIQRQCGGTEFLSQPHRLHLGAQNAAGVDELCFTLPEAWAGCTVALYLRRSDGTLLAPVSLDTQHCVTVDRRLTGSTGSHRCQRLRRLHPARQLRHLRHPAHRRRRGRAAALAV